MQHLVQKDTLEKHLEKDVWQLNLASTMNNEVKMSECLTTKTKPNKGLKDSYHRHKRCRFMLIVVYSPEKTLTIQNIHLILIDMWTLNFSSGVLEGILAIFGPPSSPSFP